METYKYFSFILIYCLFLSCGEAQKVETSPDVTPSGSAIPETNRIAPDEIPEVSLPDTDIGVRASAVKKSVASPEMAILYDYLEMNTEQVARFEVYYYYHIQSPSGENKPIADQKVLQYRLDSIFKTILSTEQFEHYTAWKKIEPQD